MSERVFQVIPVKEKKVAYLGTDYVKEIGSLPDRTRNKTVLSFDSAKH